MEWGQGRIAFHFTASGQLETTQQFGGGLLCFGMSMGWEDKKRGDEETNSLLPLPPPVYMESKDFVLSLTESLPFLTWLYCNISAQSSSFNIHKLDLSFCV